MESVFAIQLLKNSKSIEELELKRDQMLESFLEEIKKPLKEWREILGEKEFKKVIYKLWYEETLFNSGTQYFSWTSEKDQKKSFKKFYESKLNETYKMFYDFGECKFFEIKSNRHHCTDRKTEQGKSLKVKGKLLIYNHYAINYHGFGSVNSRFSQTIKFDTESNKVISNQIN